MSDPAPDQQSGSEADGAARLRLKRLFLRTMIVSLTVCALVAVGALLFGKFNETTARILGTLGALALHSGFAMVCAHSLERRRWPKLSTVGLALFGVNFAVLITCIWWPNVREETLFRALATTGWVVAFYLSAMPCADLFERSVRRVLSAGGLGACGAAFLMTLICTWAERAESEVFGKATAVVCFVAFSFAHTCLLVRVPGAGKIGWLLNAVIACVWAVAATASVMVIWEIEDEFWFRVLGALGVLDASGTLALAIMVKLRQIGKIQKLQSAAARVELRCPRCATMQTVDAGASKCGACGLKFRIEIEEPRCAKCDYLLWQLPERRCPECGTPF
jgi:hypothetical protein